MVGRTLDWKEELGRWLKPFLDRLGHKARRQMCPLYVSGLIGPGDRKSIQPMAERIALGEYDQLHHFIAAGVWDAAPVEAELLVQADRLVGGSDAVLVIDDTAIPKKGAHSVGRCAVCFGTRQDRQLPDAGVSDACAKRSTGHAGVAVVSSRELDEQAGAVGANWCSDRISNGTDEAGEALAEIDRVIAAGVRSGYVLADAGYGMSAPFRQGLTARELAWAVGIRVTSRCTLPMCG